MQLLLFDIDGTLTDSAGSGSRAIFLALQEIYALKRKPRGVTMAGKTDMLIYRELLALNRLEERPGDLDEFYRVYPRLLREGLRRAKKAHPHPGVPRLLRALAGRRDCLLALLTGNLEVTARIKLARFRLNRYFKFGAYGSDHEDRLRLPAVATRRAAEAGRIFQPSEMVIIGDTPRDIECAQRYGAKSVAVATGPYSVRYLKRFKPDLVYEDLSDVERVIGDIKKALVPGA